MQSILISNARYSSVELTPYVPNCSVPLLFEGEVAEAPYGTAGTAFLLRWNNGIYFTTAKHCLLPGDHNRLRVPATFASSDMLLLKESGSATVPGDDDDCSDFVLFSVEPVEFGTRNERNLEPIDVPLWDTMSVFRKDTCLTVRGYPESAPRAGIDYDRGVITVQAATCEALFLGQAESRFCFKLQFTESCPIRNFNHMSGSPVFATDSNTSERRYILVGMLLRAGGPERLGRFVSIECVKEGLRQFDAERAPGNGSYGAGEPVSDRS